MLPLRIRPRAIGMERGASLTLNGSIIRNNGYYSEENAGGGGIYADDDNYIQINNSIVSDNSVTGR